MYLKCKLFIIGLLIFALYLLFTIYFMNTLTKSQSEVMVTDAGSVRFQIYKIVNALPANYKIRQAKTDNISDIFISNLNVRAKINDVKEIWDLANTWVSKTQLYDVNKNLGNVLYALKNSKIIRADLDTRGTQLKFLLTLEGNQKVVFKPKWYDKSVIIDGPVYAGKDRYGSEILAFYLSGLLNKPLVPISAERTISLRNELLPVATDRLLNTAFERRNRTCVFGVCHYCKKADPICDDEDGELSGSVIFNVNGNFKNHRSPWQRTYKKGKPAEWEKKENYCRTVSAKLPKTRIYQLTETAVFDFLIQNGDRHHYEVMDDTVIWIDNGKGLGNPNIHHIDILAPLYQCCIIGRHFWNRLQQLSGGLLKEKLTLMPDITNFVTENHLNAIETRLLIIYATVEYCKTPNKVQSNGL